MASTNYKITKSDLNRCWLSWMQHCACGYNYVKMMGSGVAHVMRIPISKLYSTKEEQGSEIEKHLEFFNTEPHVGSVIIGAVIAMEEERANEKKITPEDIMKIKSSLMGPLAGIGDSLIQGAIVPIFLSIGIGLALQGNSLGPILFAVICSGGFLLLSRFSFFSGYKLGKESILKLMSTGVFQQIMAGAGIVGCTVMGALAALTIGTKFILEIPMFSGQGETIMFNLQESFFDPILLGIVPLVVIFIVIRALNKGVKPNTVLLGTLLISFLLGALGIIG